MIASLWGEDGCDVEREGGSREGWRVTVLEGSSSRTMAQVAGRSRLGDGRSFVCRYSVDGASCRVVWSICVRSDALLELVT